MSPKESLHLLLIEDNPGDARLVTELLHDDEELTQRVLQDDSPARSLEVHHETRLSAGLEYLASTDVDVLLLDLHLPDSTGIDTLASVVEATDRTPIVVLTGMNDRQIGVEAIQHGAEEYLVKDDLMDGLLIRSIHHALERKQRELARIEHENRLEALNRLHSIIRDVSHIAIQTQSKDELEERVCERLTESDAYRFAWIGEVKRESNHVVARVTAGGDEAYLDELSISIDGADTQGPTARAIRTKETHVVNDTFADPVFEPWRDVADRHGFRSSAAIPLVHDEILFGVLNVYSTQPETFSGPGAELLEQLGEIIGHAISAIERKEALISRSVNQLEFQIDGVAEPLVTLTREHEGVIDTTNTIQSDGETVLLYGSLTGLPPEEFREAAAQVDWIDRVRLMGPKYDRSFEATVTNELPFIETLASSGGNIQSVSITDGKLRVVAEFSQQSDIRRVLETIQEVSPGAELLAQRKTSRDEEFVSRRQTVFEDQLTEKQRTALEAAYFAGFFDTPRESSGEEIAESLDVSSATFFQHLRKAQMKLLTAHLGNR